MIDFPTVMLGVQWFFLLYFCLLNGGYLALNLSALFALHKYLEEADFSGLPPVFTGLEPPVTIIVPAYNEEQTITASVESLMQLNYPEYEVVVVNDGAKDGTLQRLITDFDLEPTLDASPDVLPAAMVRGRYQSRRFPNLRVLDKDNGGKADALNAGINASRYPLFCGVDADSILQRDSLFRVVRPFLDDPTTVAAGGTVRIANGCEVSGGFLVRVGLPQRLIARFQIVEYLRAFLFGRLGWQPFNALLIISGAFGVFDKRTVVEVGGYRTDTVGEDMELVVRMHRLLRAQRRKYRIDFVPDPVCWTEAPEDWKTLRNQRIRWQRGLSESLMLNRSLVFSRGGGAPAWLAYPFMFAFEWISPVIELVGYIFMIVGWALGLISPVAFWTFIAVAIGLGVLLSVLALLLEEMSFHIYPRRRDLAALLLVAIIENFGYRQLVAWWRLRGLWRWATGQKGHWGGMTRTASWKK